VTESPLQRIGTDARLYPARVGDFGGDGQDRGSVLVGPPLGMENRPRSDTASERRNIQKLTGLSRPSYGRRRKGSAQDETRRNLVPSPNRTDDRGLPNFRAEDKHLGGSEGELRTQ